MTVVAKKNKENKKLLALKNADKTAIVEVAKVLNSIDLSNEHSWVISNADINIARDLKLIDIKKYWRHIS